MFSILDDPGAALRVTFVGGPASLIKESETLLCSFGKRTGDDGLKGQVSRLRTRAKAGKG